MTKKLIGASLVAGVLVLGAPVASADPGANGTYPGHQPGDTWAGKPGLQAGYAQAPAKGGTPGSVSAPGHNQGGGGPPV